MRIPTATRSPRRARRSSTRSRHGGRIPRSTASGEAVGLPAGQQGNSEVGHLTIGAGRLIFQPLSRINRAIEDGSFFDEPGAVRRGRPRARSRRRAALPRARSRPAACTATRIMRSRSPSWRDAGVCDACGSTRSPTVATSRRRAPRASCERFVEGCSASAPAPSRRSSGRYYAMDRDRRWDRTERAYEVIVGAGNGTAADAVAYIEAQYAADVTDEFVPPVSILHDGPARSRSRTATRSIFFNFRPDRARQLSHALVDADFDGFRALAGASRHRPGDLHRVRARPAERRWRFRARTFATRSPRR